MVAPVKPPVGATSLKRPPLHNGHFILSHRGEQSIHRLLFKPLYNGNGHKSVSLTAKITSRQRPVFWATDEKVTENGQDISYRMARWWLIAATVTLLAESLRSFLDKSGKRKRFLPLPGLSRKIEGDSVRRVGNRTRTFWFFFRLYCCYDTYSECCEPCSICHVKIWFKFFVYFISIIIVFYDWITVMGYSKHELGTINALYSPRKICHITLLPHSCLLSTTATFFCPYSLRGRLSKGKGN